jgi:hypothetical protein
MWRIFAHDKAIAARSRNDRFAIAPACRFRSEFNADENDLLLI